MPKAKKEKGTAEASENVVEAADEAEWKSLKTEADRLHKLTKKEEQSFNEFQQQREKINYFWIVEKRKLDDKRAELRTKERFVLIYSRSFLFLITLELIINYNILYIICAVNYWTLKRSIYMKLKC